MRISKSRRACAAALAAAGWWAAIQIAQAGEAAKPVFGFLGPEIYKLQYDISFLRAADLNSDGLTDLLVANNAKARLDMLIQRKSLSPAPARKPGANVNELRDDVRFDKRSYPAETAFMALAVGDLNSDRRADIAFYGDPAALVVALQDKRGEFRQANKFRTADGVSRGGLAIADMNGDGRKDLVLAGAAHFYIAFQTPQAVLAEPTRYPATFSRCQQMIAADLDGDGKRDLLFAPEQAAGKVIVRLQNPEGGVGPEVRCDAPPFRFAACADIDRDGRDELLLITRASRRIKVMKLSRRTKAPRGLAPPQPRVYPLPEDRGAAKRALAVGDVDGDGRADMVVSAPAAGQLALYRQTSPGRFAQPALFPAQTGVSALAVGDLDGDGRAEVLALSKDENAIVLSRYTRTKRLAFPKPLAALGPPVCMTTADLQDDARPELIYVYERQHAYRLAAARLEPSGKLRVLRDQALPGLRRAPDDMLAGDVNGDGRPDVILFTSYEGMRVFLQAADGRFAALKRRSQAARSLVKQVTRAAVSLADVNRDGKTEMLIAMKNFARAAVVDQQEGLRVLDQFNGRRARSRILGAAAVDVDRDGREEIVLIDADAKEATFLQADAAGAYRPAARAATGAVALRYVLARDVDGDKAADLIVFGKKKICLLCSSAPRYEFRTLCGYESDIKKGAYNRLAVGDVNRDGKMDVVVLDVGEHFLDVLTFASPRRLVEGVRFKVFEEKRYMGRGESSRNEPREVVVADLTHDGKEDIALVAHDRILLYPQE